REPFLLRARAGGAAHHLAHRGADRGGAVDRGGPAGAARAGRAELRRHPALDGVPARRALLRGGGAAPPRGGAPRLLPPVPRDELGRPLPGVEGGQERRGTLPLGGALVALDDAQEGRASRAVTPLGHLEGDDVAPL